MQSDMPPSYTNLFYCEAAAAAFQDNLIKSTKFNCLIKFKDPPLNRGVMAKVLITPGISLILGEEGFIKIKGMFEEKSREILRKKKAFSLTYRK